VEHVRLRQTQLAWREVQGEVIALDLSDSAYFALNRAGAFLWPMLDDGAARAELVEALAARFGIGSDAADRDVAAFLAALRARNLLE
jgi:coenzyme PQQ synthesis protein D (PqqD)